MAKTPEGIILEKCKQVLKTLEFQGKVLHHERMNVGMVMNMQGYPHMIGRKGSADLWAFVPVDKTLWVMFFEVKSPTGRQSDDQKLFEGKFKGFSNAVYSIITDAKQIKEIVENARKTDPNYSKVDLSHPLMD